MVEISEDFRDKIISVLCIAEHELRACAPFHDHSAKTDILKAAIDCEALIKEIHDISNDNSDITKSLSTVGNPHLPLMRHAFRTTTSSPPNGDKLGKYVMTFSFRDIEGLHAADDEWRDFLKLILVKKARMVLIEVDRLNKRRGGL